MPKSPVPLGKSLAKNKSSSSPRFVRSAPVYSYWERPLDEVCESRYAKQNRNWDLFHTLAIRVRRRVEITYLEMLVLAGETLQSVYVRELK